MAATAHAKPRHWLFTVDDYHRMGETGILREVDRVELIEVADSSLHYDLHVKVPLYARQGIAEVWVVDLAHRKVLRFSRPEGAGYRDQGPIDLKTPVALPGLPGCVVSLAALF